MPNRGSPQIVGIMTEALKSGDYTDLALKCSDGTEIKAHRAVVCGMSSVMRNWCNKSSTVRSGYRQDLMPLAEQYHIHDY
jgi:hypothetical protein